MRQFVFAAAILAIAGCANLTNAASPPIGAAAAAAAQATAQAASGPLAPLEAPAGAYKLDLSHASVLFRIQHLGLAMYTARFNTFDATVSLDPQNPEQSRVTAKIDVASVDTGLDNARPGKGAGFNAEIAQALGGQPITFTSTSATRTGPAAGQVTGDLTLNGQTKPVTLDVIYYGSRTHPFSGKPMIGFAGRTTIDRTQWGVDDWSAFTGKTVEIVIEAEFIRE